MRAAWLAIGIFVLGGCSSHPIPYDTVGRVDTPLCHGSAVQVRRDRLLTAWHVAQPFGIRHPRYDVALLEIELPASEPLAILSERIPDEGEPLTLVGFGGNGEVRWSSEGRQSSKRGWATCLGWYGDSGGAVFDQQGRVVGIGIQLERDTDQTITHHMRYVPIADVAKWLRRQGINVSERE